jgi:hypothetical protein
MRTPVIKNYKDTPERKIQDAIICYLRNLGWFVMESHGNLYMNGWPDLYATHSSYGARWIEVKNPDAYSFTPAQLDTFPKMCSNGSGVWVLGAANDDEYHKLFNPPNWYIYLMLLNKHSANIPRINKVFGAKP